MTKPNNRFLIIALLVAAVLAVMILYQYGFEGVRKDMAFIREAQMMKLKTLTKYMAILAEKPYLEEKLTKLKERRKNADSKIIISETPSLAANTLEDTVKGIVTSRGGSISSERVEKPEDMGAFKVVNVTMDIVLPDVRALNDVIYGIETRTPYVVIKELDTRVRNFREPRELMVKLRVAALTVGK